MRSWPLRNKRFGRRDSPLVRALFGTALKKMSDGVTMRQFVGEVRKALVVDECRWRAVGDNGMQLANRQAPVQRNEDRPDAKAGKLHLESIRRVVRQNRNTLARLDAEPTPQMARKRRDASIKFAVAETAATGQIHGRDRIWPAAGVMGNPVIVADGHANLCLTTRAPGAMCLLLALLGSGTAS